jgi:hypothetical protein
MKKLAIVIMSVVLASPAFAGVTCRTDWKGDLICTGSNGYSSTTTTDWKGDQVTTDNQGNQYTCSTDWKGDYVCN